MPTLSVEELERLTADLASFARAGIPMPDGLRQLERSLSRGNLKTVAGFLAQESERGVPLSDALLRSPVPVAPEFASVMRCAEQSGDLRAVLDFAADHARRLQRHRAAISTALVYPLFVMLALALSTMFMLVFIVPKFKEIYDQLGAELPMPTQMIIEASNIFAHFGWIVLLVLLMLAVLGIFSSQFRGRAYTFIGVLPGFRGLAALSDTALFMKFVGRMTARGIPLPDSLRAASTAVWLARTRDALRAMAGAAEGGHLVAPLLSGEVPATAAWLFQQAEQRGDLPAACEGIADYCEDRFDRISKRALAVMEPTLLLLVALTVAFLLISMYLPLFNIPRIVGRD
jgi:type II secretory pathway component PulF